MDSSTSGSALQKRPIWVWIISLLVFLACGLNAFIFMNRPHAIVGPAGVFERGAHVALLVSMLCGAILLLTLKKSAFYFLSLGFGIWVVGELWGAVRYGEWIDSPHPLLGRVVDFAIYLLVLSYVGRLVKKGALT